MLRQRPFSAPSRSVAAQGHYTVLNQRIAKVFAQQVVAAYSVSTSLCDEGGKPPSPVQVSRFTLPCEKPLPLANVMEVQRLLFLLEAPEYCMRAFREHCVNGQDLVHMQEGDLEDSRFKFPRHVKRKVLRIAEAWRFFQVLNDGPTQTSLSLEQFLDYHLRIGSPPEVISKLRVAFLTLDVNNNGGLTFEEFLLGFSLLQAAGSGWGSAAAAQPFARTSSSTSATSSNDQGAIPDDDVALSTMTPTAGIDHLAAFPVNALSIAAAATCVSTSPTVAAVAPAATALPNPAPPSEDAAGAGNDSFARGFTSWLRF
ncbi:hypothetical protein VaNZ11_014954 [Volvox africanus]|uniref:EF-hand domain-containing protein n=1 Tax=Volvox africanus TaxID=51714 RepID=A0ABQ5SL50_9CHLO|nr:hypothetical protein VaNZ11_014954 [Volvox africanus]